MIKSELISPILDILTNLGEDVNTINLTLYTQEDN